MRVIIATNQVAVSAVGFSKVWHVLGPFQIGTREATWGADPLEHYGGFSALKPGDRTYPSSLATNGEVSWSTLQIAELSDGHERNATVPISLGFPDINWTTNQAVYGWSALQWQAWIRGTLTIHGPTPQTIRLSIPGILEFEIDGERQFGGDFFGFDRAPLIRRLEPGDHTLDVRVIRDVRAMGAIGPPVTTFTIKAQIMEPGLFVLPQQAIFPDFVRGCGSAGSVCSIPVQNTSEDLVEIVGIQLEGYLEARDPSLLLGERFDSVAPGQTRAFNVQLTNQILAEQTDIRCSLIYQRRGSKQIVKTECFRLHGEVREVYEPQKMVFQLPNDTISYAVVQPPHVEVNETVNNTADIPVLIVLHGAGVEAESSQTREMLLSMGEIRAWVIIPTGGSPWSADDWHTWGLADVQAAVNSIPEYIRTSGWNGPGVDIASLYVVGHSNGGQGTWQLLTHIPSKIRAAAPVSGYASIQKYVPYDYETEMDPRISSIIQASLTSYRHEMLVDNAKGIPIQQQHGSADDNVPVFHSRRMYQLLKENGSNPQYYEIPNKGHWYSGVMATAPLKEFYSCIAQHKKEENNLPERFSIVVPATGEIMGSRGGVIVEQLLSLGQLGRATVRRSSVRCWSIRTSNIRRIRFGHPEYAGPYPLAIQIDGQSVNIAVSEINPVWLYLDNESNWKTSSTAPQISLAERSGPQFGTINAILRTKSELQIRYDSDFSFKIALQIARTLYQYYSASCTIVHDSEEKDDEGNIITIKLGSLGPASVGCVDSDLGNRSIWISERHMMIRPSSGSERKYLLRQGLAAIYLAPLTNERLELVIWGYDKPGLQRVARLAPGLTGVGQPDFVIIGTDFSFDDPDGVLAMGFFDNDWSISSSSYIS